MQSPQRFPNGTEVRAVAEIRTTGRTLHGVAAPFDRPTDIAGMFRETILRGAFTATLATRSDILALADHRSDALLGRTRTGSLKLSETAAGLEYSLELPATSVGNDLLALAQRGDLGGMSIAFTADNESWPDKRTRQLRAVTLHEVSVVRGHPAYDGTSIALRARDRMADPAGAAALHQLRLFLQGVA
jgi:HK97 family phage prohead protease